LYVPPPPAEGQPAEPIVPIRPSASDPQALYPPLRAEKTFWQKVVVQFAIGHAF
jgi:hypothetical protein